MLATEKLPALKPEPKSEVEPSQRVSGVADIVGVGNGYTPIEVNTSVAQPVPASSARVFIALVEETV
jgi:hypothetical protein